MFIRCVVGDRAVHVRVLDVVHGRAVHGHAGRVRGLVDVVPVRGRAAGVVHGCAARAHAVRGCAADAVRDHVHCVFHLT